MVNRSKHFLALVIAATFVVGCLTSGCGGAKKDDAQQNATVANQKGDSK